MQNGTHNSASTVRKRVVRHPAPMEFEYPDFAKQINCEVAAERKSPCIEIAEERHKLFHHAIIDNEQKINVRRVVGIYIIITDIELSFRVDVGNG